MSVIKGRRGEKKNQRAKQRNAARRAENLKRMESREVLQPIEQIRRLDMRLGIGKGAKRERARLLALLCPKKSA